MAASLFLAFSHPMAHTLHLLPQQQHLLDQRSDLPQHPPLLFIHKLYSPVLFCKLLLQPRDHLFALFFPGGRLFLKGPQCPLLFLCFPPVLSDHLLQIVHLPIGPPLSFFLLFPFYEQLRVPLKFPFQLANSEAAVVNLLFPKGGIVWIVRGGELGWGGRGGGSERGKVDRLEAGGQVLPKSAGSLPDRFHQILLYTRLLMGR